MPARTPRPGTLPRHAIIDLADLLGTEWEGFSLNADGLQHPYWRRPFSCGDFKAMFYRSQQVAILERELARAKAEAEHRAAEAEAARERADWYRHQLTLESRFGLMLAAIAG